MTQGSDEIWDTHLQIVIGFLLGQTPDAAFPTHVCFHFHFPSGGSRLMAVPVDPFNGCGGSASLGARNGRPGSTSPGGILSKTSSRASFLPRCFLSKSSPCASQKTSKHHSRWEPGPSLSLSSGNPVYEKYYRQVDTGNTGRVFASDAAAFLKKSGLPDLILGKIWDLADTDGKGILNKQEFFVALRLVACAQNGLEVSLSSLNLAVPPPRFHDTSSPLLISGTSAAELPWAVKHEDKAKYDAIFDSLSPVNGFLSGDKVKPVLLNSKLPVDILGRVWELSDIDHDGMLDRDEFAVVSNLMLSTSSLS
ncbi:PREDICTED: epidermal growth factor receptor substrate 15-like [Colobus angolensis palliatus]|uniref:epidermal growth factor receptor substrate 15-like n=1 Tax=Colobus angolensis palliatus TaxID=336983 RepID=UPI0005F4AA16|nr:PREDICTED: epidermal growth factor receptor substrate 15-like [Colobus angolensis palliatus]